MLTVENYPVFVQQLIIVDLDGAELSELICMSNFARESGFYNLYNTSTVFADILQEHVDKINWWILTGAVQMAYMQPGSSMYDCETGLWLRKLETGSVATWQYCQTGETVIISDLDALIMGLDSNPMVGRFCQYHPVFFGSALSRSLSNVELQSFVNRLTA